MDMSKIDLKGVNTDVFGDANPFGDPMWYHAFNNPGYYNDTHKKLRKIMRDFVENEIMADCHDLDEKQEVPVELIRKVGETGLLPMLCGRPWPKELVGECTLGFEPDYFHELVLIDEFARCGSGGILWGVAGGLAIGLPPVVKWATPDVKKRVVPDVAAGKKIICLAITEPTAGSDVGQIKTTAVKNGDHYVVNGEKKWITNGVVADFFTVAVRTGSQEDGMKGVSMMLLERTMPGLSTRKMKCSGAWSSGTAYVTFEDVKVPLANLIGKENQGFKMIMANFNHERFVLCAMTNRFSRVCLEEALKFANKRKTFGKLLVQHDVIRWKLAEMARLVESTHAWLESVAYQMNTMTPMEATLKLGGITALLKVQCTKTFEYCAREAAQIFGGLSYTRGGQGEKVERLCREVRAMAIPGGSEEVMLDLGVRQQKKLGEMAKMYGEMLLPKVAPEGNL
mmetsp:Transcript_30102/g.66191  ORF Transcript_30102/g.66191 Transcript_30102/m.66191 type:complete len:453 (+) Transcript_30102:44-1402(+)|eukprot:CAMPEP_0204321810 /NCGR_PEP_ID=MMETSP0469-20131031/8357_1 /ASSEMBLY_ACC=CAM_ASM_000384 /TAXON_ID=2969 /ORGANISM="Oxyrrhis marina" /LENGTH=452 /DNA_ID=CAMNT_0051303135 /DNA_START=46 /DNA_END=1404 /DNA_ORIENTATION=+